MTEDPAPDIALVVDLLGRKPFPGQFSIETSFKNIADALAHVGVRARRHEAPTYSHGLWRRLKIAAFAGRLNGADVIHITGDIHFAVLGARRPVVLTVHDLEHLSRLSGIKKVFFRLLWFTLPCRVANAITVVSEATRNKLVAEVKGISHKVHVVPTVVSPAFQYRQKSFNNKQPTVLAIGTKENKNLPRLAAAMEGLQTRLLVLGDVNVELAAVFNLHKLIWCSRKNLTEQELVSLYGEADILAFVSTEEGFGMPIIEAQRVGRPVLTSTVSSMPEVAGDGALLVDPFDVLAIRQGLNDLLLKPLLRAQLVEAGLANAEKYAADSAALRLLAVYSEVLRSKRGLRPRLLLAPK